MTYDQTQDDRIELRVDRVRGCGVRKGGGLYLISGGTAAPCGKLPFALERCPTCSHGIKFSRGWTWVDADQLIGDAVCATNDDDACFRCPMLDPNFGRSGLLWIGEKFYATPADWLREARTQGISRRIHSIPLDFKLGETWVLTAHIKAIQTPCDHPVIRDAHRQLEDLDRKGELTGMVPPFDPKACETCAGAGEVFTPGVFQIFKPEAIEYVVTGNETKEEIDALIKRGITPVRVEVEEQQPDLVSEAVS